MGPKIFSCLRRRKLERETCTHFFFVCFLLFLYDGKVNPPHCLIIGSTSICLRRSSSVRVYSLPVQSLKFLNYFLPCGEKISVLLEVDLARNLAPNNHLQNTGKAGIVWEFQHSPLSLSSPPCFSLHHLEPSYC